METKELVFVNSKNGKLTASATKALNAQGEAFSGLISAQETVAQRNSALCKTGINSGLNLRIALMIEGVWPAVDGKPQKMPDFKAQIGKDKDKKELFDRVNRFASWCSANKDVDCKECGLTFKQLQIKGGLCPACVAEQKKAETEAETESQTDDVTETASEGVIVKKSLANLLKQLAQETFSQDLTDDQTTAVTDALTVLADINSVPLHVIMDELESDDEVEETA